MRRRSTALAVMAVLGLGLIGAAWPSLASVPRAHAAYAPQCASGNWSPRNRANPLDTAGFRVGEGKLAGDYQAILLPSAVEHCLDRRY